MESSNPLGTVVLSTSQHSIPAVDHEGSIVLTDANWRGESGLFDDFDYEVVSSQFEAREFGAALIWHGVAVGADGSTVDDHEMRLSAGKRFTVMDGGARVEHEEGPTRWFNKNSAIQEFINKALDLGAPLTARASKDPRYADIWVGLRFHIKSEERPNNMEGATKDTFLRWLPTAYLGASGEGAPSISGTTAAPASSGGNGAATGAGDVKKAELFAGQTDDYFTFLERATGEFGFSSRDPRVSESGPESIWSKVRASA